MLLLRARHEQAKRLFERETLLTIAQEAALDLDRFAHDLENPALLAKLGADHTEAVDRYGIFGTPTLVFANGRSAYLKMKPSAPPDEALAVWRDLSETIASRPYIEELKRPTPH